MGSTGPNTKRRRVPGRSLLFALAAIVALAGCDHDDDGAGAPIDPAPTEPAADAGEAAGGSAGTDAAPDPSDGDAVDSGERGGGDAGSDDAGDEPSTGSADGAELSGDDDDGGSDGDGGRGGGDDGGCVGPWMTDTNALEATLEAIMAAQGVEVDYEVLGNGVMEIRDDGAVIVEYDELLMYGDIGAGSIELSFSWSATGFIRDGELALEGFEEPVVDASMEIAGEPFDMSDMLADMELTTGFASPVPVAVECDGDSVMLTPADPSWALRWVPLA